MPADRADATARSTRMVLAIGFAVLLLGLLVVAVVTEIRSGDAAPPVPALTASPVPSAVEPASEPVG